MRKLTIALVLCAASAASAFAQSAAQLEANKKIIHEFYRTCWEPWAADAIPQFFAPDYKEHNPRVEPGLDGLAKFLRSRGPSKQVKQELQEPPAMVLADGDLVTWVFKRQAEDPKDKSKYDRYWFDTYRVRNGKIVEHWDAAAK